MVRISLIFVVVTTNNNIKIFKYNKIILINMEEVLRKVGLSQSEAKVYLTLIESGLSLAGEVTKKANINRSNCYDALQRLIEKGLVSYVIKANRKHFQAETPQKFLEIIKEQENKLKNKENEIKKILPKLIEKSKISDEKPEATIYKGKKGIKSIFEDILRYNEYCVFGSSGKFKEILGPFFKQFQKRVKENNIELRILVAEKTKPDIIKHAKEMRYLPKEYITMISTIVYGNKVAIISWTDDPVGFLLEDKPTSESYRIYFNFMWNKSKRTS
jgi:sugar-specific transcriptional regulator TrmB